MPDCVKALMAEYAALGETIIMQAVRQYSIQGHREDFYDSQMPKCDKDYGDLIEFDNLVKVFGMFKYNCRFADTCDLRYWLFNKECICKTP